MSDYFRVCSTCRSPIPFGADYYKCSVSTCNRKRTGLFFCSVECWDAHVPGAGHRDAWAEKESAPSREQAEEAAARETSVESETARRRVVNSGAVAAARGDSELSDSSVELQKADTSDVLVVVSKLKKYVKERSGMNTSAGVTAPLSDALRWLADQAVAEAARDERKTVMDRDFDKVIERLRARE